MQLLIGTSGYSYKHWANGVFYPPETPTTKWFEYYQRQFNAVELNVTFYRLPKKSTFAGWNKRAAKKFHFVLKGSRYITHLKRLKDADTPLHIFERAISPLKNKIKCILWQLPPNFQRDDERLKKFIQEIRARKILKKYDQVMELRHESWFDKRVFQMLKNENVCLCLADPMKAPFRKEMITADYLYLRFHGRVQYASNYPDDELRAWVKRVSPHAKRKKRLYAFFNNDSQGFAPKNAVRFRELLRS